MHAVPATLVSRRLRHPAAIHNVSYCVMAAWQGSNGQDMGREGPVSVVSLRTITAGPCPGAGGSEGRWRGHVRSLRSPLLVHVSVSWLQLKTCCLQLGTLPCLPCPLKTNSPLSMFPQIAWGLPSSTHQSKQT